MMPYNEELALMTAGKDSLKEDESVAFPTVFLKSLLTTFLIDTCEGRDVATFDLPGEYLRADSVDGDDEECMLLRLTG